MPQPEQRPPSLVVGHARATVLTADGELLDLSVAEARAALQSLPPPLVLHLPDTARRLGLAGLPALDLLELYAFACPARPAAPTVRGLAIALGLKEDDRPGQDPVRRRERDAARLLEFASHLLDRLTAIAPTPSGREAHGLAVAMQRAGWPWADSVLARLSPARPGPAAERPLAPADALAIWRRLPAFEDTAPRPPPSSHPVSPADSRDRLSRLLGPDASHRPGQADYAHACAGAFAPATARGDPVLMLAEAGTGTGKTLGYVAPASLWAERNGGAVWISTYTRHLQRQIERELARLEPDPARRRRRVVVRKGRENYLCLLNLEDEIRAAGGAADPRAAIVPLALIVRWASATNDGDVLGGDLPGWFRDLFGQMALGAIADRRGECIHGACPHYTRCFVEHSIRRAREADLVIANHALVMAQAAYAGGAGDGERAAPPGETPPTRYVFDEGHQLAEAADGAFSVTLSGAEAAELRRWLLGAEGARTRARGLIRRLGDLLDSAPDLATPLDAALLAAAQALVAPGWSQRLSDAGRDPPAATPPNPMERLLARLHAQALARQAVRPARDAGGAGGLECDLHPPIDGLPEAAATLARALARIATPLATLVERLAARLDEDAETLDETTRHRIEAMTGVIRRRALDRIEAWISMLAALDAPARAPGTRPVHVSFVRLDRAAAAPGTSPRVRDVALCRHWLDPTVPMMLSLAPVAHGILVTSATLRDESERAGSDADLVWRAAEARAGAAHLPSPARRAALPSPFDYARQARCLVVTDLAPGDPDALAAAFRALFLGAGGGGLGLFTAISRLRAVHARIAAPLEAAGIPLLAQHVDAIDNATLVDIFRTETNSCLLGTDAMRDGVDVPGEALRLVVFERVPWMRPDILHRERRTHLSEGDEPGYDDRIVRLRLRQAFGRLIRTERDRGVFVLLDRRMPSRLAGAFPPGVAVERLGLAAAIAGVRGFLS